MAEIEIYTGAPRTRCPAWLLRLVAEVEQFEFAHPKVEEGGDCFGEALAAIPPEVRAQAAGYMVAKREADGG